LRFSDIISRLNFKGTVLLDNLGNLDIMKSGGKVSKIDPATIPGFVPASKATKVENMRVRYRRINVQDPADLADLEQIKTAALRGTGTYVLSEERFVFMDQVLILIQYIEETD